jgi:pyruvate/2-oxoglutarate dehydrogenase complex dihydrolipoamide acyltransferase (E2) component
MAQSKVVQHLVTALENLRKERVAVEARIATIEKLVSRQSAVEKAAAKANVTKRGRKPAEAPAAKKAGRPAKASKAAKPAKAAKASKATTRAKKKPHWSPAARAAARERMRKYWADRRRKG